MIKVCISMYKRNPVFLIKLIQNLPRFTKNDPSYSFFYYISSLSLVGVHDIQCSVLPFSAEFKIPLPTGHLKQWCGNTVTSSLVCYSFLKGYKRSKSYTKLTLKTKTKDYEQLVDWATSRSLPSLHNIPFLIFRWSQSPPKLRSEIDVNWEIITWFNLLDLLEWSQREKSDLGTGKK